LHYVGGSLIDLLLVYNERYTAGVPLGLVKRELRLFYETKEDKRIAGCLYTYLMSKIQEQAKHVESL